MVLPTARDTAARCSALPPSKPSISVREATPLCSCSISTRWRRSGLLGRNAERSAPICVRAMTTAPHSSTSSHASSTTALRRQLGGPPASGAVTAVTVWCVRPRRTGPRWWRGARGRVRRDVHDRAVTADELHLQPQHVARAAADADAAHLRGQPAVHGCEVERPLARRARHRALEIALQRGAVAAQRAAHGFDQAEQLGHAVQRQRAIAAAARKRERVAVDRHGLGARRQRAAHELVGCIEAQRAARIERAFQAVHEALFGEAGLAALLLGQEAHQLGQVERPRRRGTESHREHQHLAKSVKPHLRARNHES
jgi:hypothetical protein